MTVHIEDHGAVRTIIHDRYEARNAMDPESAEALHTAFVAFDRDPGVSVAVLWGAGGAFCAGWDLKFASSLLGKDRPLAELDFRDHGAAVPRGPMGPTRLALSKPVIAAVEGPAVAGGMEVALWCDIRVMSSNTVSMPYTRKASRAPGVLPRARDVTAISETFEQRHRAAADAVPQDGAGNGVRL